MKERTVMKKDELKKLYMDQEFIHNALFRSLNYMQYGDEVVSEETKQHISECKNKTTIEGKEDIVDINKFLDLVDTSKLKFYPLCEKRGDTEKWEGISDCKEKKYKSCHCRYLFCEDTKPLFELLEEIVRIYDNTYEKSKEKKAKRIVTEETNGLTDEERGERKARRGFLGKTSPDLWRGSPVTR